MLHLTLEETIKNHRKMWNWIADETMTRGEIVKKIDYFKEHPKLEVPRNECYCCDYVFSKCRDCSACPLDWRFPNLHDTHIIHNTCLLVQDDRYHSYGTCYTALNGIGSEISSSKRPITDLELISYIKSARQIANLPIKNRENISDYNEEESQ